MKADTGSTCTYLQPKHAHNLTNVRELPNGPQATLPDGSTIQATQQGLLSLTQRLNIPALVFPHLRSESLLSIGQLCDAGCIAAPKILSVELSAIY